jgi:hypothetical protein
LLHELTWFSCLVEVAAGLIGRSASGRELESAGCSAAAAEFLTVQKFRVLLS